MTPHRGQDLNPCAVCGFTDCAGHVSPHDGSASTSRASRAARTARDASTCPGPILSANAEASTRATTSTRESSVHQPTVEKIVEYLVSRGLHLAAAERIEREFGAANEDRV
ncbi:MAG: hypothetical protein QOG35_1626 [Solirubrobacteraceae bacterium]|jgi:hypothetical protein|nr:hypothetical protein [Solirubrobacteraceae bacterium]